MSPTTFTKESKPITSFYEEEKPGVGATYGYSRYGYANYGPSSATSFTKETKPTTSFTKESKP